MAKYKKSILLLILALCAFALGSLVEDAAFLSLIAFIAFIVMAVKRAYAASDTSRSKVILISILSTVLVVLFIIGFTYMNPPQCPDKYTQAQIDAANGSCIIGANIGIGLYFMFIVVPVAVLVSVLWIKILFSAKKPGEKA
ncbi:MAG: hypothetical protein WD877_01315 [Candidatus Saccharimonadales bacterium]